MTSVVIDTNFSIIPFSFKVDIYREFDRLINEQYDIIFLSVCLLELKKLKYGKVALQLMQHKNVKFVDVPLKKKVDETILDYAKQTKSMIATQDIELKRKAKKLGVKTITLRQKQYLILT